MITFAWHKNSLNGQPYPVLWYGDIPNEASSANAYLVAQRHILKGDDEAEVWAQPDGTRANFCAKKYPYNDPDPVDDGAKVVIVTQATTAHAPPTEA